MRKFGARAGLLLPKLCARAKSLKLGHAMQAQGVPGVAAHGNQIYMSFGELRYELRTDTLGVGTMRS